MGRIVPVEPVNIAKDSCRFFKRHAMFLKIGDRLRNIPCKHPDVYTVMDVLIQSTFYQDPHEYPAFVVLHTITAALRHMSEARINGARGNFAGNAER